MYIKKYQTTFSQRFWLAIRIIVITQLMSIPLRIIYYDHPIYLIAEIPFIIMIVINFLSKRKKIVTQLKISNGYINLKFYKYYFVKQQQLNKEFVKYRYYKRAYSKFDIAYTLDFYLNDKFLFEISENYNSIGWNNQDLLEIKEKLDEIGVPIKKTVWD